MGNSFQRLRAQLSSDAQNKAKAKADAMMDEMPLNELRVAKHLSQEAIAKILNKKQANISRLEKNTDMYISTLKSYIEAMGGSLEILATFPDGQVKISQFHRI